MSEATVRFRPVFSFALFVALLFTPAAFSQTFQISGTIIDSTGTPVFGASVVLKDAGDSTLFGGTSSDSLGAFQLMNVDPGTYKLKTVYPGFHTTSRTVIVKDTNIVLDRIVMKVSGITLSAVDIKDYQVRMSQNGDTTNFNAGAYKTNPDASAEDLVGKLPGVTNEGGTLKVQGEDVKQVLVDGKPFLGDDPNAALKSIPADMVEGVQIYDGASEQSRFTGFDDGNSKKTVNIVTKKAAMNGQFGKVYAGYGTDDRYAVGGNLNIFSGARRITLVGMSNNVNQQNFSAQDLFGSSGSAGRSYGRGGGYSRGGPMSNFTVGQQGGISATNSVGLNYSDEWGKKIKVSGSYFFNVSENVNTTELSRTYFTDSALYYNETNSSNSRNINHRANFRLEYTIDSMNALVITPRFTSQFTDNSKTLNGSNFAQFDFPQSTTVTNNMSENLGYTFSNGINYRHRFRKMGRTISLELNGTYTTRTGTGEYYSVNNFPGDTSLIDQHSNLSSLSQSGSATISWTEPAGEKGQFLFTYTPSLSKNEMDKKTNNFDSASDAYSSLDTTLTNKYTNYYTTHRGGAAYRYNGKKTSLTVGADYQYAILSGDQEFPSMMSTDKHFQNILPNARFNYKVGEGKNLKIFYRTSTNAPDISQLQNVIDNSNPLQLRTGNPALTQDFQHRLVAHYGKTNSEKATGLFFFIFASTTDNYIGNSTYIATQDTTLPNGIFLNQGSQLITPVNLDGYYNVRSFASYSFVLKKLKSNLNLSGSAGYSRTPALINNEENFANTYYIGPGISLSSNISEKVDFTLSYNGKHNIVRNTAQPQSDNSYFTHTASARFNWIFYKGFVFNTTLDQTFYSGLDSYNTNFLLWNASLGYKFLEDKSLEAKVSVFDMLKQNTAVSRTVTEAYVEDNRTNALQQYFMFTLTYTIKHYKKSPDAPVPATEAQPAPQK